MELKSKSEDLIFTDGVALLANDNNDFQTSFTDLASES